MFDTERDALENVMKDIDFTSIDKNYPDSPADRLLAEPEGEEKSDKEEEVEVAKPVAPVQEPVVSEKKPIFGNDLATSTMEIKKLAESVTHEEVSSAK